MEENINLNDSNSQKKRNKILNLILSMVAFL